MLPDTLRYEQARECHAVQISALVQNTVRTIYPRYYLPEIVDAFCQLHNTEAVLADIRQGGVYGLWLEGVLIGTGTRQGHHITRVYVAPDFQGRGYGSLIMEKLEQEIARHSGAAQLDASLPACQMYEHRGYRTLRHDQWVMEGGTILVYEIMEKSLRSRDEGATHGP